jgi:catechol 2,3-dioxygenase-like lactoylglutathione lyase family enzyme
VTSSKSCMSRCRAAMPLCRAAIDTLTFYVTFSYNSRMQMKLELVAVPVSDVDRAKAFYTEKIGFHADHDHQVRDDLRFVQLTPPGSACSIVIGVGITDMQPGSVKGLQMVVSDVKEVRDELVKRGVAVSEIEVMPWGSFAYFSDPDGNSWSLQQLPVRT